MVLSIKNWFKHGGLDLQTNNSTKVKEYIKWH